MKAKYYPVNADRGLIRLVILFAIFLFQELPCCFAQSKESVLPLHSFEGFYRFPNQIAYMRIYQKDGKLLAKQVWNGQEYRLSRKSDLEFETANEGHNAKFILDKDSVTSALVDNRILISRVNYDPGKKMELSQDQLKQLEGNYQLKKNGMKGIEIRSDGKGLRLKQLWDGKEITFFPRSPVDFYNEELSFPLHVVIEAHKVKQVICFGKDVWNKEN